MTAFQAREVAFRELDRTEMDELLQRNSVGRLAYSLHDRTDIQPLHYVYYDKCIYGRTSEGEKTNAIRHNQWVAFEVDEAISEFKWMSVVVHGFFQILDQNATARDTEIWERAARLMTKLVPESFTDDDPVAFRTVLFRIFINDIRGRAASSAPVERQ